MNKELDKDLDTLLRFDSLQRAEEISGKSYKEDEGTIAIGLMLLQANAKAKEAILTAQNDSTFSNKLDRYLEIIAAEGFQKIFEMDIPDTSDKFFVFWHDDGILLKFDTYGGYSVNGGKFWYNWKGNEDADWNVLSSHDGLRDGLIVGDHDCREAIRYHIRRLREEGTFLNPWQRRPGVFWLTHYMDDKVHPYKCGQKPNPYEILTEERIAQFPEYVRKAITPQENQDALTLP